jgi:hypothetical protein
MPLIESLNWFLYLFIDTFHLVGRVKTWLLLALLFLLNWFILYAHYDFLTPIFYETVIDWVELVDQVGNWITGTETSNAENYTHYPAHLYLMPEYFRWAKLILALLLEGLILGAVARVFGKYFIWRREDWAARRSFGVSWPAIMLAWIIINGLMFLTGFFLPVWLRPFLDGPGRELALSAIVLPSIFTLIMALFFFTIPSIAVLGDGFVKAVRRSLRIFHRYPFTCLSLAGSILLVPIVISILSGYSSEIIQRFDPALVYWILFAGLIAELIANFFWMGTAVRFLAERQE